ncbi:MAG TPA: hypothetical protein ENI61_00080 [Ignavibacteria bacterium]|nr:hypothetical protein [Ignavibacteria bacterium]
MNEEKTAKERLMELSDKMRRLKEEIIAQKIQDKANHKFALSGRRKLLAERNDILNKILKLIYIYKKLGNQKRFEMDIYKKINNLMKGGNNDE